MMKCTEAINVNYSIKSIITVSRPDESEANVDELNQDVYLLTNTQVDQGSDVQREEAVAQEAYTLEEGTKRCVSR